ncbi:hypothetical protein [Streptomyces alfalfae]|uniref:Uncharacterized protein n=1 Tax=Streptomyces alfalfae TaxID=1642299 RepID=A0A7T4U1J2_9ACTN|nr:hypothetical protein [Streptomyces alfalfae]QQC87038.1 hypothetical protein I8755_00235 [Streptomyces alfalfae]QQC93465.1 hypothetical protein I8755_37965 [Streptomyces alfalfae]
MDQQVQFPPSYSSSSHSSWCSRTARFTGAADGAGCAAGDSWTGGSWTGGSEAASGAGTGPAHSMPGAARAASVRERLL